MAKQPSSRVRRALTKYVRGTKKNTGSALPGKWVDAKVRRLPNGKVQLKVNPDGLRPGPHIPGRVRGADAALKHVKKIDQELARMRASGVNSVRQLDRYETLVGKKNTILRLHAPYFRAMGYRQ